MIRRTKWSLMAGGILVILAGMIGLFEEVDWRGLRQSLESMNPGALLVLVAVLPIFGFSIGIIYLVVGAVFGGWAGLAVIGAATVVHLLGSHCIARNLLRAPVQRFLHRRKYQLPELRAGEEWAVALMTALVPGLPYFVRNYLLALSDIPLRIYFWVCWPVFVLRSGLVIFLGDFSDDINMRRMAILGTVLAAKVGICAYLIHRLRARRKSRPGAPASAVSSEKKQTASCSNGW